MIPKSEQDKVTEITALLGYLRQVRFPYESLIDECIEYGFHSRRKISASTPGGEKTGQTIYDSTAAQALEILGHGLHGNMLGPGWFKSALPMKVDFPRISMLRQYSGKRLDEIPEIAKWLSDEQDVMVAAYQASNFYSLTPGIFKNGGAIGTVIIDSEDILEEDKVHFTVPHFRECYVGRDQYGRVDTRIREYEITLKAAQAKFTENRMKEIIPDFQAKYKKNPYEKIKVIHAVMPRQDYNPLSLRADQMPIASYWIYTTKIILESGYRRFPSIVWDWMRNDDEDYGRSALANAINDIKTAQAQGKSNLLAGARLADPPYYMMESLRGRNYLGPGGRTYGRMNENKPEPLNDGLHGLPISMEFQERQGKIINKWLFTDIFMMMNQAMMENHNLRQAQIYEMIGERAMILSPLTEGIERGLIDPVTDIIFDHEYKAGPDGLPTGRIPMPPDILLEIASQIKVKIEVDYQGQLSLARKSFYKSQGIRTMLGNIGAMAELAPVVLKVPKWINIAKRALKDTVAPEDINSDEEIQAAIEMEAQAQQEAALQQTAAGMADAIPKLGKKVEEGSVLGAIAGV
jgi:hypothetical protein